MRPLEELFCWSFSVKDGDSAQIREKLTISQEELQNIGSCFLSDADSGILYLSTCHRIEFYGFGISSSELAKQWALIRPDIEISPARLRRGEAALKHMIRVASSLESEVLGETQITGQLKDAANECKILGLLKGPLDRCVQQALRVAKKIRSETQLSEGTVSVAHVAVDGVRDLFDHYDNKNALVIGAGTMAVQALERLLHLGFAGITWVNRSFDKIQHHHYGAKVVATRFEKIEELFWQHSVVVTATSSLELIAKRDQIRAVSKVLKKDKVQETPRLILDLGLPRNVDEEIHGFQGFLLRNVDEFRDRAEKNSQIRRQAVLDAETILDAELGLILRLWNSWSRGPLIAELYKSFEILKKTDLSTISELESRLAEKSEIEYTSGSVYSKLMHRLVEEIEILDESLGNQVLEVLVRAWRHPEKWLQKSQRAPQQRRVQRLK